ncbi:hypothetical protein PGIGA_G00163780 [Pangasianodon gigas]|uniref:Uncharacterized protein n=1 Tax=Pangasianodon gigas TaxID=30993 RepID=A0ACC5XRL0_PANGG|nr:hypothetical protein [Pangasianodon gigas]
MEIHSCALWAAWLDISHVSMTPGVSIMVMFLPSKTLFFFIQLAVTDAGDASTLKASSPRMVFPDALFPAPVFPTNISLSS